MARVEPSRRLHVTFVCTGNICRSPVAEVVLRAAADRAGLADAVTFDSAGTGGWHVGQGADERALRTLRARGYDGSSHRARRLDRDAYARADLVVALDRGHLRALLGWGAPRDGARGDRAGGDRAGGDGKVRLLRSFDPGADGPEVADPYYGDEAAFAIVVDQVEAAAPGLLEHLRERLRAVRPS
jgi:protein-tyrosine phosphatase